MAEFIAVDWGTTNRRAYHMGQGGAVLRTERDDRGLTAIAPGGFAAEARALRARQKKASNYSRTSRVRRQSSSSAAKTLKSGTRVQPTCAAVA